MSAIGGTPAFNPDTHTMVQVVTMAQLNPNGSVTAIPARLETVIEERQKAQDFSNMSLATLSKIVAPGTLASTQKIVAYLAKVGLRSASASADELLRAELLNMFQKTRSKEQVTKDCAKLACSGTSVDRDSQIIFDAGEIMGYAHLHGGCSFEVIDNLAADVERPLEGHMGLQLDMKDRHRNFSFGYEDMHLFGFNW